MANDTRTDNRAAALSRPMAGTVGRISRRLGSTTNRFHVLPDFIIVGAQRCGTTSLFRYLADHPNIELPEAKEIHFFDNHYHRGSTWYRAHFPSAVSMMAARTTRKPTITGEASPYYLFHPHAPRRIFELMPGVKLIVLLRNPVDRAYSHYQHEVRGGYEDLPFPRAVRQERDRLGNEEEKMVADEHYYSFAHQHHSYLSRGIYVDQLQRFYDLFSRDQVLVIASEELYATPARAVARALSFLGVDVRLPSAFDVHNEGRYPPMDPATRRDLIDYFRPHNQRLYEYLGVDFGWNT